MIELINITPGQVPMRKGIFRTRKEADYWILDNCDADSEYRRDPYSPSPDNVLFEIPGDKSGLLIENPSGYLRVQDESESDHQWGSRSVESDRSTEGLRICFIHKEGEP